MNTRTATRVALGAVVVLGLLVGRAGAAETAIVSAAGMSYLPPVVTVHEGDGLRFVHADAGRLHDVSSDARDEARLPLFASSPAMTAGQVRRGGVRRAEAVARASPCRRSYGVHGREVGVRGRDAGCHSSLGARCRLGALSRGIDLA